MQDDLATYIADHYGLCGIKPCSCLKNGWLGRRCVHWTPMKAKNWQELIDELREQSG